MQHIITIYERIDFELRYMREIRPEVDAVKIEDTDECRKELKEVFDIEPQDIIFDHNNEFVVIRVPNGRNDGGKNTLVHDLDYNFYLVRYVYWCPEILSSESGFFFEYEYMLNMYYKKVEEKRMN